MNQNETIRAFDDAPANEIHSKEDEAFLMAIQDQAKRKEVILILKRAELIPW